MNDCTDYGINEWEKEEQVGTKATAGMVCKIV